MRTSKKMINEYSGRTRRAALIAAIIFALSALAMIMLYFRAATPAIAADDAGSVTIHVYDPEKKYSDIGAWVWLKGGSGTPYTDVKQLPDEKFKKDTLQNTAYSITVPLSKSQVSKLKTGTQLGFLICSPSSEGANVWGKYNKETQDVFIDISTAFDDNDHVDVYYIRKDIAAFTDVEEANMALEKVSSARFTSKDGGKVVISFESTMLITKNTVMELHEDGKLKTTANAVPETDFSGTVTFEGVQFSFSKQYSLYIKDVTKGAMVSTTAFIDDKDFIMAYECEDTQNLEYGALYDKTTKKTTFRVWAPMASDVTVNIYNDGATGEASETIEMTRRNSANWGGVWEAVAEKDIHGRYYTYTVNNAGSETETIDPYAKACGVNGGRGMILDLDTTDPEGWENDGHLYSLGGEKAKNADTPIIWEVQVKDFSGSPDSGMKYKGKYLAFTEQNTTVPGKPELRTGVNYLKNTLGITYVHLNPVYDFVTVDESDMSIADDTKDNFNWGYDPQNYNIPEGSYSTDPFNGDVRIREFKQMVMALHEAGIGVIMDVVYNHTYATGNQALNDTVPYYYHRTTDAGTFSDDSGCGNGTASERTMMRKYMIESLVYWATEYHIDGFRFDLMGIHDVRTLNMIRDALDAVENGAGKKLLMYGEPWSADGGYIPASFTNRVKATNTKLAGVGKYTYNGDNGFKTSEANMLFKQSSKDWVYNLVDVVKDRIAIFGDSGRDGLRGNNDPGQGWANGDPSKAEKVKKMMEGYCGTSGEGITTSSGSQCIAYASAHDNYTLWDQVRGKQMGKETPLFYENYIDEDAAKCALMASAYIMSNGVPFMLAGEEMGRTKFGNHNSYNSAPKLNQIVWSRQEQFAPLVNCYAGLIKIRKANNAAFSYSGSVNPNKCYYDFTGSDGGKIAFKHLTTTKIHGTLDVATLSGSVTDGTTTVTISKKSITVK